MAASVEFACKETSCVKCGPWMKRNYFESWRRKLVLPELRSALAGQGAALLAEQAILVFES